MGTIPTVDMFFDLEKSLKSFGFEIRDNSCGSCIAYGYSYKQYGKVSIEFNQCFLPESMRQTDMLVFYYSKDDEGYSQKTLYRGVAPTNQHDFDTLMQLLFPSDEFRNRFENRYY